MAHRFSTSLFAFLKDLREHNDGEWFAEHSGRFERDVRDRCWIADIKR